MTEDRRSPLAIGRPVQSVPPFKNAGGAGDNENSLYQQTLKLLAELRTIPELDKWIFPYGRDNEDRDQAFVDPVATLWACFRLGKPLCILYNALKPKAPLPLRPISIPPNATSYPNSCKKAVYDFVVACKKELGMDENNLFTISGLYKDDTNEFVKLLNTLNIIVGKMRDAGLLPEPEPLPFVDTDTRSAPRDHADKLLAEILNTERSYISDLEYLQKYKIKLQDKGQIPKSTVTTIFSNLDNLLDFQRRFLLQMEAALVIGSTIPKLGALFLQNEAHFSVYIIFCSNYQNATKQAAKYESSFDPIDPNIDPVRGLQSYLIKPIQRLCKYPLFLQELIKYTDQSSSSISELKIGLDSIRRVITLVNEEKRREENFLIKLNFIERMKDWRGINVRDFGDLLLCDTFVTTSMDVERPWEFFLFETILLCVKDTGKKKKSRKINRKDSQILHGFEPYTSAPTTYVLKGQILVGKMIYVTDTPDKNSTSYILKIFWTEGQTTNYVSLKCRNSEQSRQWKNKISSLIKRNRSKSASVETVNQRYNEPGRPIDSSTLETRRTNKHHSGSDIYMVNESDNSIDSLPNQIARSTLAEPPGMVSDFQKGNYTAMSSTIPYPIVRDANRVSISDGRNPYTAGDSYQVEEHATRDQIADSIQPVGATSRDLSRATNAPSGLYNVNQKYRTFSLSNNIDSSNGATSYHETSLSEDDPKDSTLLGAKVTRQDKHISKKSETPGVTDTRNGSAELSAGGSRGSNISTSAGMIIGTYDDHTYDYGPADNHSQSSSTPDESDPLDDLEPFVNSQKFDPAACNFNKVDGSADELNSFIDDDDTGNTKDDTARRKKSLPSRLGISKDSSAIPKQRASTSASARESSKLATMSSKLDGIAMSFAHVAEEEFEKDSLLDKSLTKETNHKNESDEQRSSELRPTKPNSGPIYLRVNYHLNSYTIALVPPVSYNALYEKVRNKVNLSKGIPTPSEDNRTGSKFSVSGIHDNRASSGVQSTQLDKIKISYALDNGTTSYVESDKEAREAADPNRRHFSDGIFVS